MGAGSQNAARTAGRQNLLLAALGISYVVVFAFCDALTRDAQGMPALWPVNAIGAAGLLHLTPIRRLWLLAVCVATQVVGHALAGDPWGLVAIYTLLDTTESVLLALIAARATRGRARIRGVREALLLIATAAPVSAMMASIGAVLTTFALGRDFGTVFVGWLFCNVLGMAIALPATLVLLDDYKWARSRQAGPWVKAVVYGLVAAATLAAFARVAGWMAFLVFPAAMLAAFRLGPKGAAWSVVIVAALAMPLFALGESTTGGASGWTAIDQIRLGQVFITLMFLTTLTSALSIYREDRLKELMARRNRHLAAARERAQAANKAKSEFLATMSHELRTPLNSVLGFANVIGETEQLSAEGRRRVALIAASGRSLVTLVDDLLAFARLEAGRFELAPQPVNPLTLVRETAGIVAADAERKGLELTLALAGDERAKFLLDPNRLRQVVLNLLNNAVKFTSKGAVQVTAEITEAAGGHAFRLDVRDSGIGMSAAEMERIFERFSQADGSIGRRFGGTGLGLAISRSLLDLMGGEIGVESAPGEGARFWVTLPLGPLQAASPELAAPDATRSAGARVLVVDDHPMNRELCKLLLELEGHQVAMAEDGEEAVQMATEHDFDVILMDVRMPKMDGLAATRAIRALGGPRAQTPIIAVTAEALPEQVSRCREAGMVDHVAKPIAQSQLSEAVHRWLPH
ncbi:MAG: histidine kinase [Phenylobacterium sp.]|uniref:hybrid sensor histidine kinase/response regulator n=1 Tax=Phenylobacterium sp. TaxID=1871053 RepID=UPI0025EA0960|nr:response regulator [Phenylobacterium sp.]MBA4013534.1 histidine kinase [Phenylobacterium sp.]